MFRSVQFLAGINVRCKTQYVCRATFGFIILVCISLSAAAQNGGQINRFSEQKIIVQLGAIGAESVYTADLDGDGDQDVLSASFDDNKIAWYENNGNGAFGEQRVITTRVLGAISVYAADLDGDGDPDVLSASFKSNRIAWYENDGNGGFGPQQVITTSTLGAESV